MYRRTKVLLNTCPYETNVIHVRNEKIKDTLVKKMSLFNTLPDTFYFNYIVAHSYFRKVRIFKLSKTFHVINHGYKHPFLTFPARRYCRR